MSNGSGGKGFLITGLIFLTVAIVCGVVAVIGVMTMRSGAEAIAEEANEMGGEGSEAIAITVPGESTVELKAKKYAIWADNPKFAMEFGEDVDIETGDNIDVPEPVDVTWEITGPADVDIVNFGSLRMGSQVQVGSFEITQPGTYTVTSTLAESVEDDSKYTIDDDAMAMAGEFGGEAVKTVGGFLQMVGGGLCAGMFGLIALILIAIHFMKGSGGSQPAPV